MSRAWDLLKGKKARQITGANIEGVGSSIFIQPENKVALKEWEAMSRAASTLAFKGGLPWPDSIILYQATPAASSTATIKPSTLFDSSLHPDAAGYLCVLYGISIQGSTDAVRMTISLYDGSTSSALLVNAEATPASPAPQDLGLQAGPIYFTEDVYITAAETAGASAAKVDMRIAIISRGGNPQ